MSLDRNSRPYFRLIDRIVDSDPFRQRVDLAERTIGSVLFSKKQAAILPVEASREIGIPPALRNGDRFNRVQFNEQQMKELAQSAVDAALKVEVGREMATVLSRTGSLDFNRTMRKNNRSLCNSHCCQSRSCNNRNSYQNFNQHET